MKKYLGIDFGEAKIGVSYSEGKLANPIDVIFYKNEDEAIRKLVNLIKNLKIDEVVFGITNSQMGEKTYSFSNKLKQEINVKISFFEENYTTNLANLILKDKKTSISKRKKTEDAIAASIMLEGFLENQ